MGPIGRGGVAARRLGAERLVRNRRSLATPGVKFMVRVAALHRVLPTATLRLASLLRSASTIVVRLRPGCVGFFGWESSSECLIDAAGIKALSYLHQRPSVPRLDQRSLTRLLAISSGLSRTAAPFGWTAMIAGGCCFSLTSLVPCPAERGSGPCPVPPQSRKHL